MHIGKKLEQEATRKGLKPADVAKIFGVKPPSVYDWYEHGRMHKKHYPALLQWSDKPIEFWLGIPASHNKIEEPTATYIFEKNKDTTGSVLTGLKALVDALHPNVQQAGRDVLVRWAAGDMDTNSAATTLDAFTHVSENMKLADVAFIAQSQKAA